MLYLDTEFNSFHGELISLAIACDDGDHFYEVLPLPKVIHPWVAEHVVPFLNREPIDLETFRDKLWKYMRHHDYDCVVADWPEDFAHLLWNLCRPDGVAPNLTLNMAYFKSGKIDTKIPHNALSDAIGLMEWHQEKLREVP